MVAGQVLLAWLALRLRAPLGRAAGRPARAGLPGERGVGLLRRRPGPRQLIGPSSAYQVLLLAVTGVVGGAVAAGARPTGAVLWSLGAVARALSATPHRVHVPAALTRPSTGLLLRITPCGSRSRLIARSRVEPVGVVAGGVVLAVAGEVGHPVARWPGGRAAASRAAKACGIAAASSGTAGTPIDEQLEGLGHGAYGAAGRAVVGEGAAEAADLDDHQRAACAGRRRRRSSASIASSSRPVSSIECSIAGIGSVGSCGHRSRARWA